MTATYSGDRYPIKITQGDDWTYPMTFSTRLNGVKTPIDLSSATIVGVVRPKYTSGTLETMGVTINDGPNGQVTFSLTSAQTDALPSANLVYQITITISGEKQTYLQGSFTNLPRIQTV